MLLNINKTSDNVNNKIEYDEYMTKRNNVIYLSRIIIKNDELYKVKRNSNIKKTICKKAKKLKPKVYTNNIIKHQIIDNG